MFTEKNNDLFEENNENLKFYRGKLIREIIVDDNMVKLTFDDKTFIKINYQQVCCEDRYFHTDDDLKYFEGSTFYDIDDREVIEPDSNPRNLVLYNDIVECQFLIIRTDRGEFTVASYNVHNGYYADMVAEIRTDVDEKEEVEKRKKYKSDVKDGRTITVGSGGGSWFS